MKTLYCLPGTQCTSMLWDGLKAQSPNTVFHHVAIPDAPTPEAMVDELLSQLPDHPVSLLGFSLGGYLSCALTAKAPERVSNLVVVSNSPCALNDAELTARKLTLSWLKNYRYTGITRAKALSMLDVSQQHKKHVERIIAMDAELGGDVLTHQLSSTLNRKDLSTQLRYANVPIQFIASRADPLINQQWLSEFAANTPHCDIHYIEGRGHMLPFEEPEIIAEVLATHA